MKTTATSAWVSPGPSHRQGLAGLAAWLLHKLGLLLVLVGVLLLAVGPPTASLAALVGLVIVWRVRQVEKTALRLGRPQVRVSCAEVAAGQAFSVCLTVSPARDLWLEKLWVELICDQAASPPGQSEEDGGNNLQILHRAEYSFAAPLPTLLRGGHPVVFETFIGMPEDAPPTQPGRDRSVQWSFGIHASVRDCPEWEAWYSVKVVIR